MLAKILSVWNAEKRASVRFTPGSVAQPGVGGEQHGELLLERHLERVALHQRSTTRRCAGGSGASGVASGTAGCASAMASARDSAASASRRSVPRTAAKPHAPPTRTRTPIPSLSRESSWSSVPLRVESRSTLERTKRASA